MIKIKPFVQTDDSRCGPATLKMILDFYGIDSSEDELCIKCNHTYELGCTNDDMENVLQSYGFKTISKNYSTIDELNNWIRKEIPVIIDWFSHPNEPNDVYCSNGHSSIVVDIDDKFIYILDPEIGKIRKFLHDEFLRVWFDWETSDTIDETDNLNIRYMLVVIKE